MDDDADTTETDHFLSLLPDSGHCEDEERRRLSTHRPISSGSHHLTVKVSS